KFTGSGSRVPVHGFWFTGSGSRVLVHGFWFTVPRSGSGIEQNPEPEPFEPFEPFELLEPLPLPRAHDLYRRAPAQSQRFGSARRRRGELEVIGAAEERPDAVGRQLGVGGDEALDARAARVDRDRAGLPETLHRLAIDVRDEVAEAIHADDDPAERVGAGL